MSYLLRIVFALFVFTIIGTDAQESVNAHEGFDVGMQAGIALGVCFSILGSFALVINVIKKKCVKNIP
jgi:hypothetical protein